MSFDAGKVIAGALVSVVERRAALVRCLGIPFALYVLADLLYLHVIGWDGFWIYVPFTLAINAVIAINTHRQILLGSDSVPTWGLRAWDKREWRFVGFGIAVAICLVPAAALAFIPYVGPLLAFVLAFWLLCRLSLIFPAVAVDTDTRFSEAWQMSAPHQWSLIVSVGIFPVGLAILDSLILMPVITITDAGLVATVLSTAVETLTGVFAIAALSLAYHEVRRLEEPLAAE